MKIKYNYEDYLFLSARIRSLENGLIGGDKIRLMASAPSLTELSRTLEDCKITPEENEYGVKLYEKAFSERLEKAYYTVLSGVPDKEIFAFFTYQYDCHNLKSAIKAAAKGVSPEKILMPFGSVDPEKAKEAVRSGDFSEFPENMAKAASESVRVFAETSDPQRIDLLLDRACFEDIKNSVGENPVRFFGELLKLKADTVNIFTALRLCRMPSGDRRGFMEAAFLPGGSLGEEFFVSGVENGEAYIAEKLKNTEYSPISEKLNAGVPSSGLERITDDMFMKKLREARSTLSGAEVLAGYIAATEYEVKNLRLILAGKNSGKKPEEILERLRESYV